LREEIKLKLNIIDNELLALEERVKQSKDYLINNLNSPFSNQTIEIIEKAENQLNNLNNLDEIRYFVKEINLTCDKSLKGGTIKISNLSVLTDALVTIKFKNTSNLAKEIAGHNVVVSKDSDFDALTNMVDPSNGMDEGFLPSTPMVIGKTPFLGPNETYDLKISTSKLNSGQTYVFWCSYPGHWGIMKGNLVLN